jgi:hypothetical protein
MNKTVDAIITSIYNLVLIAGTAYLVVERGWSSWWFALTILLLGSWGSRDKEKNDE